MRYTKTHHHPPNGPCSGRQKPSILLADNNQMVLDVLTLSLREHGYMVNAVKDGWDVLKSMFHSDHDAILLDLNMPRLDGITTVKALRKMDPHTYVLIISGEASEFKIKQALEQVKKEQASTAAKTTQTDAAAKTENNVSPGDSIKISLRLFDFLFKIGL